MNASPIVKAESPTLNRNSEPAHDCAKKIWCLIKSYNHFMTYIWIILAFALAESRLARFVPLLQAGARSMAAADDAATQRRPRAESDGWAEVAQ